jgi:hypothetical protein
MYELTELQEKWLKALESGEYAQARGLLGNREIGFCCLGLLCDVAGADYCDGNGYPEHEFAKKAGLITRAGSGRGVIRIERLTGKEFESLAHANDAGATFAEIAAAIRANPENFFLPADETQRTTP